MHHNSSMMGRYSSCDESLTITALQLWCLGMGWHEYILSHGGCVCLNSVHMRVCSASSLIDSTLGTFRACCWVIVQVRLTSFSTYYSDSVPTAACSAAVKLKVHLHDTLLIFIVGTVEWLWILLPCGDPLTWEQEGKKCSLRKKENKK